MRVAAAAGLAILLLASVLLALRGAALAAATIIEVISQSL